MIDGRLDESQLDAVSSYYCLQLRPAVGKRKAQVSSARGTNHLSSKGLLAKIYYYSNLIACYQVDYIVNVIFAILSTVPNKQPTAVLNNSR